MANNDVNKARVFKHVDVRNFIIWNKCLGKYNLFAIIFADFVGIEILFPLLVYIIFTARKLNNIIHVEYIVSEINFETIEIQCNGCIMPYP